MSERLDLQPKIVASRDRKAIAVALAIVAGIGIWLEFGRIPDVVHGRGILMRGDSVLDVPAGVDGVVEEIITNEELLKNPDRRISEGEQVAKIYQPELKLKIELAKEKLKQLIEQDRSITEREQENQLKSTTAWDDEQRNQEQARKDLEGQVSKVTAELAQTKDELKQGKATRTEVVSLEGVLLQTNLSLYNCRSRLTQIMAERTRLERELLEKSSGRQKEIAETTRMLNELTKTMERTSQIRSPYNGKVLEKMVERGNLVLAKDRVLTMEPAGDKPDSYRLQAIIYVPAGEGKKIEVRTDGSMPVRAQISPSTVKIEEHGFVWGKVTAVSSFPSTPEGMRRVLRNDALVSDLSGQSTPIAVSVELEKAPGEGDRYIWSSPSSGDLIIRGGTLCSATIIIGTKRPIDYLIPYLKRTLW